MVSEAAKEPELRNHQDLTAAKNGSRTINWRLALATNYWQLVTDNWQLVPATRYLPTVTR